MKHLNDFSVLLRRSGPNILTLGTIIQYFYLGEFFEVRFLSLSAIVAFASILATMPDDFIIGAQRHIGPMLAIPVVSSAMLCTFVFGVSFHYVLYAMGLLLLIDALYNIGVPRVCGKSNFEEELEINGIFMLFEAVFCSQLMLQFLQNFFYIHVFIVVLTVTFALHTIRLSSIR